MNFKCLTTVLSLLLSFTAMAQKGSDWKTYLAYGNALQVEETNNKVFVVADGALYSYETGDGETVLYSKQNGLNDTGIDIIRYSPDNNMLVIVYSNGNIDLLSGDGVRNMSELKIIQTYRAKVFTMCFSRIISLIFQPTSGSWF